MSVPNRNWATFVLGVGLLVGAGACSLLAYRNPMGWELARMLLWLAVAGFLLFAAITFNRWWHGH